MLGLEKVIFLSKFKGDHEMVCLSNTNLNSDSYDGCLL